MAQPIRKSLRLKIAGTDIEVPVTFAVIETIERVFKMRAEFAAAKLQRPAQVLRHEVADAITDIVSAHAPSLTRAQIREAVTTANAADLGHYVGCIQAAVLYSLKEMTPEEFDDMQAGKGIQSEPDKKKVGQTVD